MSEAKKGDSVKIHYTGTLDDGTVFDSSEGREPLEFKIGGGQVIVGFEEAVLGMSPGESKKVNIPADKAYGQRMNEMVITVPNSQIPPDIKPEVGLKLQMGGPGGELLMVEVVEVAEEHIILDANPPLAGQDLNFEIEMVEVS